MICTTQAEINLSAKSVSQLIQAIAAAINAQQAGEVATITGENGQKIGLFIDESSDTQGENHE